MNRYGARRRGRGWIIPASFLLALLFNVIPGPEWMKFARPDWVTLVLFYWCMAMPQRVGVGYGWAMGLLLDLLRYTLFGQHALGKALIALIVVGAHRRLRLYYIWQQCAVLLAVASIDIGIVVWVHHLTSGAEVRLIYWQAALTTALLWPIVYVVLRKLRRQSGMIRQ